MSSAKRLCYGDIGKDGSEQHDGGPEEVDADVYDPLRSRDGEDGNRPDEGSEVRPGEHGREAVDRARCGDEPGRRAARRGDHHRGALREELVREVSGDERTMEPSKTQTIEDALWNSLRTDGPQNERPLAAGAAVEVMEDSDDTTAMFLEAQRVLGLLIEAGEVAVLPGRTLALAGELSDDSLHARFLKGFLLQGGPSWENDVLAAAPSIGTA